MATTSIMVGRKLNYETFDRILVFNTSLKHTSDFFSVLKAKSCSGLAKYVNMSKEIPMENRLKKIPIFHNRKRIEVCVHSRIEAGLNCDFNLKMITDKFMRFDGPNYPDGYAKMIRDFGEKQTKSEPYVDCEPISAQPAIPESDKEAIPEGDKIGDQLTEANVNSLQKADDAASKVQNFLTTNDLTIQNQPPAEIFEVSTMQEFINLAQDPKTVAANPGAVTYEVVADVHGVPMAMGFQALNQRSSNGSPKGPAGLNDENNNASTAADADNPAPKTPTSEQAKSPRRDVPEEDSEEEDAELKGLKRGLDPNLVLFLDKKFVAVNKRLRRMEDKQNLMLKLLNSRNEVTEEIRMKTSEILAIKHDQEGIAQAVEHLKLPICNVQDLKECLTGKNAILLAEFVRGSVCHENNKFATNFINKIFDQECVRSLNIEPDETKIWSGQPHFLGGFPVFDVPPELLPFFKAQLADRRLQLADKSNFSLASEDELVSKLKKAFSNRRTPWRKAIMVI